MIMSYDVFSYVQGVPKRTLFWLWRLISLILKYLLGKVWPVLKTTCSQLSFENKNISAFIWTQANSIPASLRKSGFKKITWTKTKQIVNIEYGSSYLFKPQFSQWCRNGLDLFLGSNESWEHVVFKTGPTFPNRCLKTRDIDLQSQKSVFLGTPCIFV